MRPFYAEDGITIYHGDCREVMPALEADALITDPPYGLMARDGKVQMRGAVVDPDYGEWDRAADFLWLDAVPEAVRSAVVFHDYALCTTAQDALRGRGWTVKGCAFWDKGDSGINPRHTFVNAIEQATYARRGRDWAWNGGGATVNVFHRNRGPAPWHPTQKPEDLMVWLVRLTSAVDQVVIDPFMGSGSTLVAAKRIGRRAIGIELDRSYCETAVARLRQRVLPLEFA